MKLDRCNNNKFRYGVKAAEIFGKKKRKAAKKRLIQRRFE